MAVFPTGFVDRTPSRTAKVLGDNGTANGNFTVAQILDLIQLGDLPPGTATGDFIRWDGTNWQLQNETLIPEMTVAAALGDANQFALDQGGAATTRASMSQLFTYMLAKFYAANAVIEDVPAATTAYTFTAADKNKVKRFNASANATISLPTAMPIGYTVGWIQQGTGILSFETVANAGQIIQSPAGSRSAGQFGRGALQVVATNTWNLSGYTQV